MKIKAVVIAAGLVASVATAVSPAGATAAHSTVGVSWHKQVNPNESTVDGAWARLVRNRNGISYSLHAAGLTPGHAYTLWQVVINNPSACADATDTPLTCTPKDVFRNAAADAQVSYAAGHVVGESGRTTFTGSQRVGAIPEGWMADRGLVDPAGAEVHLVVNDHGPALPEFMPGMIRTYRGGCSDSSPFPPIFPPKALADGEVGRNTCRLTQVAIFR